MLTMVASRPTMSRLIEQMPRMTSRVRRSGRAWGDSAWALTLLDPRRCLWSYDDGPIARARPRNWTIVVGPEAASRIEKRERPRRVPPGPAGSPDAAGHPWHLLDESAHRRPRRHHRQHRAARDPPVVSLPAVGTAVDDLCLHAGHRQPAHA